MHAVILCPGPSLDHLAAIPTCDLSIAVNRAALKFPADVVAMMDYPMLRKNRDMILGNPSLYTFSTTWGDVGHRLKPFPSVVFRDDLQPWWAERCHGIKFPFKTFPASVVYAASRGASRIDIYGCDWQGVEDFDGTGAGEDRTEARWDLEQAMCRDVFGALAMIGVAVRRMNCQPTSTKP